MCLCGVGGAAHPREIEERLTRVEILEWMAMYALRPFGTKRDDLRAAIQTFWAVSVGASEVPSDHSPQKYMLEFDDKPPGSEAQSLMNEIKDLL